MAIEPQGVYLLSEEGAKRESFSTYTWSCQNIYCTREFGMTRHLSLCFRMYLLRLFYVGTGKFLSGQSIQKTPARLNILQALLL
jgi:hypothetical protein